MVTCEFGLTWPDTGKFNKFQIQTTLKHNNAKFLKGFTLLFYYLLYDLLNCWSQGSSLEYVESTFRMGNSLKLTHILQKIQVIPQHSNKKKMKTLIRQESIKTKKIYLQEHDFCIQEKTDQLSLSFGQYYLANFLLHIVGMLKIYIFITYYCYNIVHEN